MRNAKIVCTLGPATDTVESIEALTDAGMSVARINASHGSRAENEAVIDAARTVDERTEKPVAVMLDTQGPEVRTADVEGTVTLDTESAVTFAPGEDATGDHVGVSASLGAATVGDHVVLDDGRIDTVVESVDGETVQTRVESGGELGGRKGVNVPGVDLDVELLTEKDRADLALAAEKRVDFVAASFVRDGADVLAVSEQLEAAGADIPVIAKIERAGAVENLDSIVDAADGVMVARGDLGVECPMEEVPMVQKRIIRSAIDEGIPVITATEMLDSMVHQPRPTRAEASDVANAVLDGTDAVMLSAETAVGDHPARVVETMDAIVREVEASEEYAELNEQRVPDAGAPRTDALARSARYLARDVDATAVVVASETGYTARKTAKFRPNMPILATTPTDRVRRQLALSWGVNPQYDDLEAETATAVIDDAVETALETDAIDSGDTVVVVSGMMSELEGTDTANVLKVHVASETLAVGRSVSDGRVSGPLVPVKTGALSDVEDGAILEVGADFDGEFDGDRSRIGGIIDARSGVTGYPAVIARELGVPMVSNVSLDESPGTVVTLDGERGVVYAGDVRI